jgi:DNA-binding FrmR family transcriptional regulator
LEKSESPLFFLKSTLATPPSLWYTHTPYGYDERSKKRMKKNPEVTRKELLARLSKVEGQVRGVMKMIENERKCSDVLRQIAATDGALRAAAKIIVTQHMDLCLHDNFGVDDSGRKMLKEVLEAFGRFG